MITKTKKKKVKSKSEPKSKKKTVRLYRRKNSKRNSALKFKTPNDTKLT